MANVIRNARKLKMRMAQWLNLHDSDFNLEFKDYIAIANKRDELHKRMFHRRFAGDMQELYEFEMSKKQS